MRIAAIMNPVAGASRQRRLIRNLLAHLAERGNAVELHQTTAPGDAVRLARDTADRADAIIAIGGDGTVCEVVNGLVGRKVPLLIWPTGTENLVAKSLGFRPRPDVLSACLDHGFTRTIDIGTANGRSFVVVAGVGFDAEVVHRLTRDRRGHITHLSYSGPIWRTFWEHRFPELRVQTEAMSWNGRGLVFVGNMARYALGLPVVRDALPDDGLLDLLILPCHHQVQLLGHSIRTLLRIHVGYKGVIYERVRHAHISSDEPVPFELDGDAIGTLPLEVSVVPAAVHVLAPPKKSKVESRKSK
jgi:YegS/Rv2252/BmrU family lipid kinase